MYWNQTYYVLYNSYLFTFYALAAKKMPARWFIDLFIAASKTIFSHCLPFQWSSNIYEYVYECIWSPFPFVAKPNTFFIQSISVANTVAQRKCGINTLAITWPNRANPIESLGLMSIIFILMLSWRNVIEKKNNNVFKFDHICFFLPLSAHIDQLEPVSSVMQNVLWWKWELQEACNAMHLDIDSITYAKLFWIECCELTFISLLLFCSFPFCGMSSECGRENKKCI